MKREDALEHLQTRYPDLAFLLSYFPYDEVALPGNSAPLEAWLGSQNLDEIEVLYLIGLIGFDLPKVIYDWLAAKKERALVFVEDALGAFPVFAETKLFLNPQIHFHYAEKDPIEALASRFPVDRLAVYVPEGKTFDALNLVRKSAALSALYSDVLYSHLLTRNVLANMERLPTCFAANEWKGAFSGIPAIICGAGPSLEKSLPLLAKAKDQALIFGGGSAITALTQNGIQPHLAMALDPNDEEYDRLRQSHYFEGPFLFAPRLHRDVFATSNGPFGYLKSDTGGLVENWLEEKLGLEGDPIGPDLGMEAFSVTTLAVSYAYALGCDPIILVGVDLAYTGGKRYVKGVKASDSSIEDPRALEKPLIRKDIAGEPVETLLKWVMESDAIAGFAKNHPDAYVVNATEGGLGFSGIENTSLEKALKEHGQKTYDIDGMIHQKVQEAPIDLAGFNFHELWNELDASLERCDLLCTKLLEENEIIHEYDLRDEVAYECFLSGIDAALNQILPRYYPHLDEEAGKAIQLEAKYLELKRQIKRFHEHLPSQKRALERSQS